MSHLGGGGVGHGLLSPGHHLRALVVAQHGATGHQQDGGASARSGCRGRAHGIRVRLRGRRRPGLLRRG
eukprot:13098357-Alexandrium_andersonii.AAC.1